MFAPKVELVSDIPLEEVLEKMWNFLKTDQFEGIVSATKDLISKFPEEPRITETIESVVYALVEKNRHQYALDVLEHGARAFKAGSHEERQILALWAKTYGGISTFSEYRAISFLQETALNANKKSGLEWLALERWQLAVRSLEDAEDRMNRAEFMIDEAGGNREKVTGVATKIWQDSLRATDISPEKKIEFCRKIASPNNQHPAALKAMAMEVLLDLNDANHPFLKDPLDNYIFAVIFSEDGSANEKRAIAGWEKVVDRKPLHEMQEACKDFWYGLGKHNLRKEVATKKALSHVRHNTDDPEDVLTKIELFHFVTNPGCSDGDYSLYKEDTRLSVPVLVGSFKLADRRGEKETALRHLQRLADYLASNSCTETKAECYQKIMLLTDDKNTLLTAAKSLVELSYYCSDIEKKPDYLLAAYVGMEKLRSPFVLFGRHIMGQPN